MVIIEKSNCESQTSGANVNKVAQLLGDERARFRLTTAGILIALTLAVSILRLHRLSELPPGLHHDEGTHGVNALQVMQGEHAAFFPENNGREGMIVYAIALATSFLGRTALAVRLPTATVSAATVVILFWLGWLLFRRDEESGRPTPWRGLLVGGAAAGLLAVSLGQTVIGRTALRGNLLSFFLCISLALLWWGWSQSEQVRPLKGATTSRASAGHDAQRFQLRNWWQIALAGLCTGLLPYTYITARFTPFLFLLFGLSFLLPWCRTGEGRNLEGKGSPSPRFHLIASPTKEQWQKAGIFVVAAGLVAAPILLHFAQNPDHFFLRSAQTWVFDSERSQGNALATFMGNVWGYVLAFGFRGDLLWRHNLSGQPLLNLWQAFFFWLGAGTAVWHWRKQPAYRLLLLWLVLLLLPAVAAREITSVPPNTIRMIGAMPAICLLAAVGIWEAVQYMRNRFSGGNELWAGTAFAALISLVILAQGVFTYRSYFHKWAAAPEIHRAYGTEWLDLISLVNHQPPDGSIVYIVPGFMWQYSFEFLYQGEVPVHLVHTAMPDFARHIESALADSENLSELRVVDWTTDVIWSGDEDERLAILLDKYGRYLDTDEYDDFQVKTYTDITLDRPWKLYDKLESLQIDYDGGISLLGLATGQGTEQLSGQNPLILEQDRSLWLALQWQTAPELGVEYAISLRLHDADGNGVYQKDFVLWRPDHSSTRGRELSEPFDSLHLLDLPVDLQTGAYELRIVVYDSETLKPTVELGVWEPETTLARLQLVEGQ